MDTFSWLHLSDIHFRTLDKNKNLMYDSWQSAADSLTSFMNKNKKFPTPQAILISGDMAFTGEKKEFKRTTELLDNLCKKLNLDTKSIFVVPGNHDLDMGVEGPTKLFLNEDLNASSSENNLFYKPFHAYNDWCKDYLNGRCVITNESPYHADSIKIDNKRIGIVGLNTSLNSFYNYWKLQEAKKDPNFKKSRIDFNQGKIVIGQKIVDNAYRKIARNVDAIITMAHHPLSWLTNNEEDFTKHIIQKFSHIYLQGHIHAQNIEPRQILPDKNHFIEINSGAFHLGPKNEYWNTVMIGSLAFKEKSNIQLTLYPYYYQPEKEFQLDHILLGDDQSKLSFNMRINTSSMATSKNQKQKHSKISKDENTFTGTDPEILEKLVDIITSGLEKNNAIKTTWTLNWTNDITNNYVTQVFPIEQTKILAGYPVERIMAHISLMDILKHVAIHGNTFPRSKKYKLHVPQINEKAFHVKDVLKSKQMIPKLEIVLAGKDEASIDFPSSQTEYRSFKKIHDEEAIAGYYDKLYNWFVNDISRTITISNDTSLNKWLNDVEKILEKVAFRTPSERNQCKILRNIIFGIRETKDGIPSSLNAKWWDGTAPDYKYNFIYSGSGFLSSFFSHELNAVDGILKDKKSKITLIEIGCGTGRFLSECMKRHKKELELVVGVDFSKKMLNNTKSELESLNLNIFIPIHTDIRKPSKYLQKLIGKKPKNNVVCMLGLLPNISPNDRITVLNSIRQTLQPDDEIIVSSYDGKYFKDEAYKLYTNEEVRKISGSTILRYDVRNRDYISLDEEKKRIFYSHWFTYEELRGLLKSANFEKIKRKPAGKFGLILHATVP